MVALLKDGLYRDVLVESAITCIGFVLGLQRIVVDLYLVLHLGQPQLQRLDDAAIMQLERQQHLNCRDAGCCRH